ncbi:MAG: hypothetical protein R3F12_14105 [Lysobacteraceae bacterium]
MYEPLRSLLIVGAVLFLTAVVYWPGLSGGFIFDDFPFIVENPAIRDLSGSTEAWLRAIFGFPVEHQGRWLGMLSFAVNAWLHGFQPFGFKALNLLIHLVNGLLVWVLVRRLLRLLHQTVDLPSLASEQEEAWVPILVASLWLVLPINLTAVLYVVQRLESLSNLFVLAGIASYLGWRMRFLSGGAGMSRGAGIVVFFSLLGGLVKESALLLPLYTAIIELVLLRQAGQREYRSRILRLYCLILGVPLVVGGVWFLGWSGGSNSYPRHFSTYERVLTESRVLFMYMEWTLLPLLSKLALFHDDITLSKSMFSPWTTCVAIAGHALLIGVALFSTRRLPLFSLGVLLFYSGHIMTGTVVPLEIVFEHRNYFPSIGLLLATSALLSELLQRLNALRLATVLVPMLFTYYAGITFMRSSEWGDPLLQASAEVARQPESERAINVFSYELLRLSGGKEDSPYYREAMEGFRRCAMIQGATITCDAALILEGAASNDADSQLIWQQIISKLERGTARYSDMYALSRLVDCFAAGNCVMGSASLGQALAVVRRLTPSNQLMLITSARFSYFIDHDDVAAEQFILEAIHRNPDDPRPLLWLATLRVLEGRLHEATAALDRAENLRAAFLLESEIQSLKKEIAVLRKNRLEAR